MPEGRRLPVLALTGGVEDLVDTRGPNERHFSVESTPVTRHLMMWRSHGNGSGAAAEDLEIRALQSLESPRSPTTRPAIQSPDDD
jgi:hypothetical protein